MFYVLFYFFIVSNLQYFVYSLIILHMFTILFFLCKHAKYQASFCISSELKTTKFEVKNKTTT